MAKHTSKYAPVDEIPVEALSSEIKRIRNIVKWGEERLLLLQERIDREQSMENLSNDCRHPFSAVKSSSMREHRRIHTTNTCGVCGKVWKTIRHVEKNKGDKHKNKQKRQLHPTPVQHKPKPAHSTPAAPIIIRRTLADRVDSVPW